MAFVFCKKCINMSVVSQIDLFGTSSWVRAVSVVCSLCVCVCRVYQASTPITTPPLHSTHKDPPIETPPADTYKKNRKRPSLFQPQHPKPKYRGCSTMFSSVGNAALFRHVLDHDDCVRHADMPIEHVRAASMRAGATRGHMKARGITVYGVFASVMRRGGNARGGY
jgi:hypothetical protein